MKKILSVLLLSAMLAVCFSSCENVGYIDTSTASHGGTVSDIYQDLESRLPDSSELSGREFVIATDDTTAFYQDESTASTVSASLEERNSFLRQKYGVTVKVVKYDESDVAEEIRTSVDMGYSFADVLAFSGATTVSLFTSGLLYDMLTLPDFDPQSTFFDTRISTSLATNSRLFMLPDATALVYEDAYVMFFNRQHIADASLESPETLVQQGKWTWDSLYEICKVTANKVYKQATSDLNSDIYGFGSQLGDGEFSQVMWESRGTPLLGNTYKTPVVFGFDVDEAVAACNSLRGIYNTKVRYPLDASAASDAFRGGRMTFFCDRLYYLRSLRDGSAAGAEYGILPLPKFDEAQQDYFSFVSPDARVFSVPVSVYDTAKVSTILTAMCAVGNETVKKAFINSNIALYLNSNSEALMLETITDTLYFDFSAVYSAKISAVNAMTKEAITTNIDFGSGLASSFRKKSSAFEEYCAANFT